MNDATNHVPQSTRLTGEDLTFWWGDSPTQPTTMAMLMLFDRSPDPERLRLAFERAVAAVPRLAQHVVDAPLDITLPRWEWDPTFDLDYHVRHHSVTGPRDLDELFREIAPTYETGFDRSRPLWEARIYDGLEHVLGGTVKAALFFKLHHAVADGVGGNAIFAAMTDWEREPADGGAPPELPRFRGAWPEQKPLGARLLAALRDRIDLDLQRAGTVASTMVDAVTHPDKLVRAVEAIRSLSESFSFDSHTPLKEFGRARRLSGLELPFEEVRAIKRKLGGTMIDVILAIMARGMGKWHRKHRIKNVSELMTLVPVNLRKPEEWTNNVNVGNVATGILVPLPIGHTSPVKTFEEIRQRMDAKKKDPASHATPMIADMLSVLPRQFLTWMAEASFGSVDFIVTNVPGILVPRYMAGAEILAAYPFAPVARKSPASVALYGYREHLHIGLNSDDNTMPDVGDFKDMVRTSFRELKKAGGA